MRNLIIEKTASSPKVVLDPENSLFEISGESRPSDVLAFYGELINWIDEFAEHLDESHGTADPIIMNLDFEYFNSSSAKYLLDFCKKLANIRSKGHSVAVRWHYETDDTDMLEVGQEMSKLAKIPFEFIQKHS